MFGEELPLTTDHLVSIEYVEELQYDPLKGYYVIGSNTSNSFQKHFYEFPNRYESVRFRIKNDSLPRKIYICHKTIKGGSIVEGGIALDEKGNPLPVLVQVSKNFAGEKEEKFYNPEDTPFSETFVPFYLEPFEKVKSRSCLRLECRNTFVVDESIDEVPPRYLMWKK